MLGGMSICTGAGLAATWAQRLLPRSARPGHDASAPRASVREAGRAWATIVLGLHVWAVATAHAAPSATAATTEPPPSALAQLAERLASALIRQAGTQALELVLDDRTGTDGALGADLAALTLTHLATAGVRAASTGARVRAATLLVREGRTLVLSSRLTREPGAQLVDVLSLSAEADAALLARGGRSEPVRVPGFEVRISVLSALLDERVLALAWLDDRRLLLLTARAIELYEWDGSSAVALGRRSLPEPLAKVRFAAGLLHVDARGTSAWALTSGMAQALHVRVRDRHLEELGRAPTLPWPRLARGLTFRPGSALIEAEPSELGDGPFVALEPGLEDLAVAADGALLMTATPRVRSSGVRVGPALARLSDGWIAAASPQPPEPERDAILLLQRGAEGPVERGRLATAGAVRALAAFVRLDGSVGLVAALGAGERDARLQFFELRRSDVGVELP